MKVVVVSGPRGGEPMGLELAESRLIETLRAVNAPGLDLRLRVVGLRAARAHARRLDGRWVPASKRTLPNFAVREADLVHLVGLDLPPPRKKPFLAMVHDLSPLHYDDEGELPLWMAEIVERANALLTPSSFTAGELVEHFGVSPERIAVIGGAPALDASTAQPLSEGELRRLGIEPPYVLRSGGYTKRKNVALLLEAWASVPIATLVLTGPAQPVREELLRAAPTLERVAVLDYVPATLLARLLRGATALVSTSEYEGFGLPPLEAMAAGTPVVAADASFVREVCGDAALVVEATPPAIAEALARVLEDASFAAGLSAAGRSRAARFTWSRTAQAVLGAYVASAR